MEQVLGTKKLITHAGTVIGDKVFRCCCWLYLVAFAILPDWFGFYIGMLFSAKRIMLLICFAMILFNRMRLNRFAQTLKKLTVAHIFIGLYMLVRIYTAIYRISFQIFFGEFLDGVLVFYFFCYLLKYEIKVDSLLNFLRITLWVLCAFGLFENFTHINVFAFLNTTNQFGAVVGASNIRGELRLNGNCHHPIQFGMYISMLFCLSCYNPKTKKLFLFRSPALFVLSTLCVFFSGSRGPFGLYLFSLLLICLFSGKDERIKSLVILFAIIAVFVLVLLFIYKTYAGQWTMQMFASVVDSVFGTSLVNDHFSQLGVNYDNSTAYREALAKVFQLDYLNPLMGRGGGYSFSVVIDGIWLRSGDNNYVITYIGLAYPGLVTQGLLFVLCLLLTLIGRIKQKNMLCGVIFVATVAYIIGLWFVAAMGTFMYFWMMLAIVASAILQQNKEQKDKYVSKAIKKNIQT